MALSILKMYKTLSKTHIAIHVLCCLLGIASWVDLSGVWLQLPILVTTQPEGLTLSSIISIIMQIGNIGPVIFGIVVCIFPKRKLEKQTTFIIIVVGIVACVLLIFFWDKTSIIGGELRSTALCALIFFLSLVDSTSSLSFLAFMAMLKEEYLPAYFVGEGLSSFLPALVALGQGVSKITCVNTSIPVSELQNGTWNNHTDFLLIPMYEPPRISVQIFFLILAGFLCLSLIAFVLLVCFPRYKIYTDAYCAGSVYKEPEQRRSVELSEILNSSYEEQTESSSPSDAPPDTHRTSLPMTIVLLVQMCWSGIMLGVFFSIQPYISVPYGLGVYHLSTILASISLASGSLVYLVIPVKSHVVVFILTVAHMCIEAYFLYMAFMSPTPPLLHHEAGPPLLIILSLLVVLIWSYQRVIIAGILRPGGRRTMLWVGVSIQTGTLIGGVVGFLLVSVYHVFNDVTPC